MQQKVVLFAVVAITFVSLSQAACPNRCSGHGSCGINDVCSCQQKWMGADCSLRKCPYARAWIDTADRTNEAHFLAECSNKGACDRATGMCACDPGYTGSACRRMACPDDCSGHGTCEFVEEFAADEGTRLSATWTYTQWDQEKAMGCKCDPWWTGHDCATRMCPYGDDPLTGSTDTYGMQQFLEVTGAAQDIYLTYKDIYGNEWETDAIRMTAALGSAGTTTECAAVQTALRRIPNHALADVTVTAVATGTAASTMSGRSTAVNRVALATTSTADLTVTAADTDGGDTKHRCKITFPAASGTTGYQELLVCSTYSATAYPSGATGYGMVPRLLQGGGACAVAEYADTSVVTAGSGSQTYKLNENVECSNRGICDGATGICACFSGHKGVACETQEALV